MPAYLLLLASAAPQAPQAPTEPVSVTTALLFLILVGLLWCASNLARVHEKLAQLEQALRSPAIENAIYEDSDDPPAEVVAAISAACIATYGPNIQIVRVQGPHSNPRDWALEGRRHIFSSHSFRS